MTTLTTSADKRTEAPAAAAPQSVASAEAAPKAAPAAEPGRGGELPRGLMLRARATEVGRCTLLVVWQAVSTHLPELPGPDVTWQAALAPFAGPFFSNGPNGMGIGWNVLYSLKRVGSGFGLAAGPAADRPAGLQERRHGGNVGHLRLLDLADVHQHRASVRAVPQD